MKYVHQRHSKSLFLLQSGTGCVQQSKLRRQQPGHTFRQFS